MLKVVNRTPAGIRRIREPLRLESPSRIRSGRRLVEVPLNE
jgi:hypothetical protein